jgi:hypothetical protein
VAYSLGAHAGGGVLRDKTERRNDRAVIVQAAYRGLSGWIRM